MFVWFTVLFIVKKTRFKRKRCSEIWLRTKFFWANFVGKRRRKKKKKTKNKNKEKEERKCSFFFKW